MNGFGGVEVHRGALLGSEVGQLVEILLGCAGEGQPIPKGILKTHSNSLRRRRQRR